MGREARATTEESRVFKELGRCQRELEAKMSNPAIGGDGKPSDSNVRFSMMTFNILEGGRPAKPKAQGRLEAIRDWIRSQDLDLVLLNECNGFTEESIKELARAWGHNHVAFGNAASTFHVALTSRYPFVDPPLWVTQGFRHGLMVARITFPFGELLAMATHLTPASGSERIKEAEFIANYVGLALFCFPLPPFFLTCLLSSIGNASQHLHSLLVT